MTSTRNLVIALLLLVFGAMFIAACGGDDDDDAAGTAATATREQSGNAGDKTDEPTKAAETPGANPTDKPDDGGTVADACALVTQSEAEAALGDSLQTPYVTYTGTANVGLSNAQATVSTCAYVSDSSIASLNVNYWSSPGNAAAVKAMVEGACTGKEMIDGLGDVACWYDSQHVEIQLATGATFLDIFATMDGDSSDALLDLSGKAVGRLS
jgi:hypothetical protein